MIFTAIVSLILAGLCTWRFSYCVNKCSFHAHNDSMNYLFNSQVKVFEYWLRRAYLAKIASISFYVIAIALGIIGVFVA